MQDWKLSQLKAHQQILALIESICNEVIGSDEHPEGWEDNAELAPLQNKFRAEQRARLKDILEGK